jgi:hypothetical protein
MDGTGVTETLGWTCRLIDESSFSVTDRDRDVTVASLDLNPPDPV